MPRFAFFVTEDIMINNAEYGNNSLIQSLKNNQLVLKVLREHMFA